MSIVVDRRDEASAGRASRERLVQRTRQAAREAINKSIQDGKITDLGKGGVDVIVPKGGLSEPVFKHGQGGVDHRVLPGNNNEKARFRGGDRLPRNQGGSAGGGGGKEGGEGESEDSFVYHLSEKEFLDLLFEDLALPNIAKFSAEDTKIHNLDHAGYSHTGTFNRLSLPRSKFQKSVREIMMGRPTNEKIVELLVNKIKILSPSEQVSPETQNLLDNATVSIKAKIIWLQDEVDQLNSQDLSHLTNQNLTSLEKIDSELSVLFQKRDQIRRWREDTDLRFRTVEEKPFPASKAVMFCEMDVSSSMGEEMKSNAKLFFFLLYRFLKRQYEHVDIVWIRHTDVASEVDEKEFFEGRISGGTKVSSAHALFLEIQKARYPEREWNIYGAHASDGDNLSSDSALSAELMKKILAISQGFFHVEVVDPDLKNDRKTDLWQTYEPIAAKYKDRFWMEKIYDRKSVFPVFRDLFKKQPDAAPYRPAAYAASLTAYNI